MVLEELAVVVVVALQLKQLDVQQMDQVDLLVVVDFVLVGLVLVDLLAVVVEVEVDLVVAFVLKLRDEFVVFVGLLGVVQLVVVVVALVREQFQIERMPEAKIVL